MRYYRIIILFCLVVLVSVPATEIGAQEGGVNHVVLLWLKQGTSETQKTRIIEETRKLAGIAGVSDVTVGTSISSQREIVDDSFDIGIYMKFSTVEEMNRYLDNDQHITFVDNVVKPNIVKITVYDF